MVTRYIDRQKQRIEDIKNRMHRRNSYKDSYSDSHSITQRDFYWVYGLTPTGKKVTLGAYTSTAEADRRASQLDEAEIFELPTRDRARAVQMIRAKLLKRGEQIDKALERQLSEKGLQRERKKLALFRRR